MSEKQFDIFDEPFRKAAGQYEPGFSEAAWKKMEAKLDGEPGRRKPVGWLWWFSDVIMIILVITLLFEINAKTNQAHTAAVVPLAPAPGKTEANTNSSTEKATREALPPMDTGVPTKNAVAGKKENLVRDNNNSHPGQSIQHTSTGENQKPQPVKKFAGENPGSASAGHAKDNPAGIEEPQALENQLSLAGGKTDLKREEVINHADPVPEPAEKTSVDAQSQATKPTPEELTVKAAIVPATGKIVSPAEALASPATGVVKPALKPFRGFYFQAGIAPEWSFIAGNKAGPVTAAYGVTAGYAFGNRWSVLAGIFSTQKNYEAGPGDYKAEPGSYYATVKIYHVDAECRVIELPLLVNYQVLARGRQTLVGTAGFASLLMKKETYDYHYERWNGMPAYSEHSYQTNSLHPFASMYLGAGYGYNLNGKLALSASPYLKIPLYGVGEGNVKITSAGVLFGVQYGISTRRNDKKAKSAPVQK